MASSSRNTLSLVAWSFLALSRNSACSRLTFGSDATVKCLSLWGWLPFFFFARGMRRFCSFLWLSACAEVKKKSVYHFCERGGRHQPLDRRLQRAVAGEPDALPPPEPFGVEVGGSDASV